MREPTIGATRQRILFEQPNGNTAQAPCHHNWDRRITAEAHNAIGFQFLDKASSSPQRAATRPQELPRLRSQGTQRLSRQLVILKTGAVQHAFFDGPTSSYEDNAAIGISLTQLFSDSNTRSEMPTGATASKEIDGHGYLNS